MGDRRFGDVMGYNKPDGTISATDRYLLALGFNPPGGDSPGAAYFDGMGLTDSLVMYLLSVSPQVFTDLPLCQPQPMLSDPPSPPFVPTWS